MFHHKQYNFSIEEPQEVIIDRGHPIFFIDIIHFLNDSFENLVKIF